MCLTDCISIGLLQCEGSWLQLQSCNFEFKIYDVFPGGRGEGGVLSRDY